MRLEKNFIVSHQTNPFFFKDLKEKRKKCSPSCPDPPPPQNLIFNFLLSVSHFLPQCQNIPKLNLLKILKSKRWSKDKLSCHSFLSREKYPLDFSNFCWKGHLSGLTIKNVHFFKSWNARQIEEKSCNVDEKKFSLKVH